MSERQMRRARERQVKREHRDGQRLGSRSKLALGAGAALGASAVLAPAAQADTFQVTSTEDELDPGPTAVECDDDCTLREALYEANDDSDGPDTITFAANVTGTITVDAGYDQFYIQEGVTIQGPGANVLAISGGDDRRVFYVNTDEEGEPHESVTISGLTLTQGFTPFYGGALYSYDSALTLADVVVDDNYAGIDGGGVWSSDGRLTITNSLFTGNVVENYDGGALALEDTEDSDADDVEVLISGSVFSGNSAGDGDGDGGALYLSSADGDVVIENTTVAGNRADDDGGGLWLRGSSSGDLTIRGSTISNNESYENDAGGAYISDIDGDILIENSTVSGNSAAYDGGGIYFDYLDEDSTTTIRNSTIVNNVAGVDPGDYGDYGGGGVYLYEDSDGGGDDEPNGPVVISSTIVANNTADFGADLGEGDFTAGFDVGFSLIESTDTEDRAINESPAATNIFGVDPQLGALANNGGLTQTHRPAASSPAIDKGIANGLATDQRGLARTFDGVAFANAPGGDGTDIGSVEVQPGEGGLPGNAQCQGQTVPSFTGTEADDTLTGTTGPEALVGLAGNDTLNGLAGKDCLDGDQGRDRLNGGGGADRITGGGGKDKAKGQGGKDNVKGGGGRDNLKGSGGKDRLKGQGGKDKLNGGGSKDTLKGGAGKDKLRGGPAKDKLKGQGGKDRINAVDGKRDKVNCGGSSKDKVVVDPKDKVSDNCERVVEKG